MKSQKRKGGTRKRGREKRKALRHGSPMSLFAQGKISGEAYFRLTKQKKPLN